MGAVPTVVHHDRHYVLGLVRRMVERAESDEPGVGLLTSGHIRRTGLSCDRIGVQWEVRDLMEGEIGGPAG